MKTIEERAKKYAEIETRSIALYDAQYVIETRYASYKEGAAEQKAIDDAELLQRFEKVLNGQKWDLIDRACEWLKSYRQETPDGLGYNAGIINDKTIEDFRKAMEE